MAMEGVHAKARGHISNWSRERQRKIFFFGTCSFVPRNSN
jgi:hypothetical protein